jgi:uncharacterized protein (TIGR02118 family)
MAKVVVTYGVPSDVANFDRHYREVHIPLELKLPGLKKFKTSRRAGGHICRPFAGGFCRSPSL